MALHPKILELRNKIPYQPIYHFVPSSREFKGLKKPDLSGIRKTDTSGERLIKQYFCIFGIPDDYGTIPVRGGFSKSIQERGPESAGTYKIKVLNQHDAKDPLCNPKVLKEDEWGLYGEYEPDEMPSGDRLLKQVRSGTINNGSYGFNYVWDKMEYDDKTGLVYMKEMDLFEVSPVSIPSQLETFIVRNRNGVPEDTDLEDDTEDLISQLPRKYHLELRTLISRHISLSRLQPAEQRQQPLEERKPRKRADILYNQILKELEND